MSATSEPEEAPPGPPSTAAVVAGFGAIYFVWGSTYLGIRFAIETLPPFLMAGARFLMAGALLYVWARHRGSASPTGRQVRDAVVIGSLMLLIGNGGVVWAEQWVPSGLAALLVATLPFWMVLLDWLWAGAERPRPAIWLALSLGLAGVGLLTGAGGLTAGGVEARVGAAVVILAALAWAVGSIYAKSADIPRVPHMASAIQMLAGGVGLVLFGSLRGEWVGFDVGEVSLKSWLALAYLTIFGSIIAYHSYMWLLRVVSPARVSTYAYVNPLVALFLGWALADEPLESTTLIAAALILGSVVYLNLAARSPRGVRRGRSTRV